MRAPARTLLPLPLVLAAVAACAGCGGAGSSSPTVVVTDPPVIGFPCSALAVNGPPLLSPAPGSTGIPITITSLTFGRLGGIPDVITGNATLTGSDNATLTSGPLTPSPDYSTTSASISGLHAHTTYTVTASGNISERGCMFPFAANDGTFTTQ